MQNSALNPPNTVSIASAPASSSGSSSSTASTDGATVVTTSIDESATSGGSSRSSSSANVDSGGGGGGLAVAVVTSVAAATDVSGSQAMPPPATVGIGIGIGTGSGGNSLNGHERNKQNGFTANSNININANNNNNTNNNNNNNNNSNRSNSATAGVDAQNNHDNIGDGIGIGGGGDGCGGGTFVGGVGDGDAEASLAATQQNIHLDKSNQEIIRLIGQYLQDIGLDKSVKMLMTESGCYLEHPSAMKFREHVLSGEWIKADADLKELEPLIETGKPTTIIEMKFILLEQKYLEHLDDGCPLDALHVLRNELTPLQHNVGRVHQLSSYMMCSNNHDLYQRAKWEGKGILSRALVMERLQAFMPPSVMMPPRRLRGLLQQAIELQTQHCPCHDMAWETSLPNVSLLTDHCCATDGFPMQTIQILTDHCDEVWFCKFSPDGLKLATGSKDATVIIWDVDPFKLALKHRRVLDGQSAMSVAFVSWSPDSKLLLVGGPEDSHEICVWNVEDGTPVAKLSQSVEDSLACGAFNRDGTRFVCGGQKGQFFLCDLTGTIIETWEGVRINSVAFRADNKTILAADNHYRIRGYNFETPRSDFDILKEPHPIMTFSINSADRLALLNISNQGLHLWDLEDKCLVRRFQGIRQSNFAIHSCFGGVNESFVASGSEDKLVCIWHIKREEPLAKLSGHTKTVNCVSWNPVYPSLLASASDDATVRIWGPKPHNANATPESDDCSSCSSSSSWNMTSGRKKSTRKHGGGDDDNDDGDGDRDKRKRKRKKKKKKKRQ